MENFIVSSLKTHRKNLVNKNYMRELLNTTDNTLLYLNNKFKKKMSNFSVTTILFIPNLKTSLKNFLSIKVK